MRLKFLKSSATGDTVKQHIMKEMGGHSIVGSKTANHFINVHIDRAGHITAFDAQDGLRYDGKSLYARLGSVDLFLRLL